MRQDELVNFFNRAVKPLKDRVFMLVGRAVLMAIDDSKKIQEAQISALAGEDLAGVQRFQEFGFTSNPPAGTEAVIVSLGGSRNNCVVIATDNRNVRMKNLASGETAIYTDDGTYIILKKAGEVEIKSAVKLTVDVPESTFKGRVIIEDTLRVMGAASLENTLLVKENATLEKNATVLLALAVGTNATVTGVVAAAGFTGPAGGAATLTVDITTTGQITAANVTGGGTTLSAVKSGFNTHTHVETGGTTNPPGAPL